MNGLTEQFEKLFEYSKELLDSKARHDERIKELQKEVLGLNNLILAYNICQIQRERDTKSLKKLWNEFHKLNKRLVNYNDIDNIYTTTKNQMIKVIIGAILATLITYLGTHWIFSSI